jgi:FkbM family methyltransferase
MIDYTQYGEGKVINHYFKDFKGTVLDIGANDGKTFSNSLALIENGWNAILIEPNKEAFKDLTELHKDRYKVGVLIPSQGCNPVTCLNIAIGNETKTTELFINEPHIKGDNGLLSTFDDKQKLIWGNFFHNHKKQMIEMVTFEDLIKSNPYIKKLDFITIDVEGMDFDVLKQIDFDKFKTRMVCVEYNNVNSEMYEQHMAKYGFNLHYKNFCNLIFTNDRLK